MSAVSAPHKPRFQVTDTDTADDSAARLLTSPSQTMTAGPGAQDSERRQERVRDMKTSQTSSGRSHVSEHFEIFVSISQSIFGRHCWTLVILGP
jgi:hypothetical protein